MQIVPATELEPAAKSVPSAMGAAADRETSDSSGPPEGELLEKKKKKVDVSTYVSRVHRYAEYVRWPTSTGLQKTTVCSHLISPGH